MRLLQEAEALDSVPEAHQRSSVRFPIKVDLRDFATWLSKKNPFNVEDPNAPRTNWHKSLEAFLAALIANDSGGSLFTNDDLIAFVRISAVLLVFDGLDEVADINRRKQVVEEIVVGVARLKENATSLQVIVTSRPAAFVNSPGMPHADYPHLQLGSLNRNAILKYAERWLAARKSGARESAEFRRVLKREARSATFKRSGEKSHAVSNPVELTFDLGYVLA